MQGFSLFICTNKNSGSPPDPPVQGGGVNRAEAAKSSLGSNNIKITYFKQTWQKHNKAEKHPQRKGS